MTGRASGEQKRIVLTAHPLQRVGAFALCALARGPQDDLVAPDQLPAQRFDEAVERMTADAVRASLTADTKAEDGFWLKASGSFFPNSKMNHPSRQRNKVEGEVRQWRGMPAVDAWPTVGCALCGRQAVGFYGKADVALAESVSYRNTVPRGHGGLALCWPCLCCFYALPYGCVLTGGQSSVLHSLGDDDFVREQVFREVDTNYRHIMLGLAVAKGRLGREAAALVRLRGYHQDLRDGVDLMIFSNNNREQSLAIHSLAQPMAEWLRQTRRASRSRGFAALVRAHRTRHTPGIAGVARNAFHHPSGIIAAAAGHLSEITERAHAVPDDAADLARICRDFAGKVLQVNNEDVEQVEALAASLAAVISADTVSGPLTGLLRAAKNSGRLQALLQTMSARWLLTPPRAMSGPLLTTRQFRLLFDPDGQSWLYRQLLTIAVLQKLSELGWRPGDARETVVELDSEILTQQETDDQALMGLDGEQA